MFISAFKHFLPKTLTHRSLSTTMAALNGKPVDRTNLIPFSSRLKVGRALAEDVWSIFK